jgi:uncharacterized protein (TIGR03435 family)
MRNFVKRKSAFLAVVLFIAGFIVSGAIDPALGQLLHPSGPLPSFEVATINQDNDLQSGPTFQISSGRFFARHFSLKDLIEFAYHSKTADQLVGGPGWKNSDFFTVEANIADAEAASLKSATAEELTDHYRLLTQVLLADRFQLKVSFKMDSLPVYALVVMNGDSKMNESAEIPAGSIRPAPMVRRTGTNQFTATNCTMTRMVDWLSHFDELSDRMVVDETGLKGHYDFVLSGVTMGSAGVNASASDETTSIFTALREQLGLKLESRKAPVEILVIDHVERPSPN